MRIHPADEIGRDETEDTALGGLHDKLSEPIDRYRARPALVYYCRYTRAYPAPIGFQAKWAEYMFVDMGVGVDHARQHIAARDVDHPLGTL